MMTEWRSTALLVCGGLLWACGGGGGSAPPSTPTPTYTATRTPTSTPTAPPGVFVTSVFPAIGSPAGGTAVVIEGTGFSGGGRNFVAFEGTQATSVVTLGDRRISCLTPSGQIGTDALVAVTNERGTGTRERGYHFAGGGVESLLDIELAGEPTVVFDDQIGTTTVVTDYLVRDSDGVPLDESDLQVSMFVDGIELGSSGVFNESVLDRNSEELDLSVLVLMVLDASFSLQQFSPPQFTPMLNSAQRLVDTGTEIWRNRGGTFSWGLVWFDELISQPDPRFTSSFRIANIPAPQPGNFTKLYGAVSNAVDLSSELWRDGVAAGPRDRHVLVVFTDGLDNLSSFDNRDVRLEGRLKNGDPYPRIGWKGTELPDVVAEIARHPAYPSKLTVHTIALGLSCDSAPPGAACFDEVALGQIAQVGFGQQLSSAGSVSNLFDQIQKEFTTLQSSGAKMALRQDDYEFRLQVSKKNGGASGEITFTFRVSARSAEFVGFR